MTAIVLSGARGLPPRGGVWNRARSLSIQRAASRRNVSGQSAQGDRPAGRLEERIPVAGVAGPAIALGTRDPPAEPGPALRIGQIHHFAFRHPDGDDGLAGMARGQAPRRSSPRRRRPASWPPSGASRNRVPSGTGRCRSRTTRGRPGGRSRTPPPSFPAGRRGAASAVADGRRRPGHSRSGPRATP